MVNYRVYIFIGAIVSGSFVGPLSATKNKDYVTCHFIGQLGNQLYQAATTLAYAWDHGVEPLFPELGTRKKLNIHVNRERIFFRLNASELPRPTKSKFSHHASFEYKEIPVMPDQLLDGYFQSWKYFNHHRDKLVTMFAPAPRELKKIEKKYAEILYHPFTVGVHVRTYNKPMSRTFPFVGLDYYQKALSKFPQDALFVVFSDRINWTKHHFKKFKRNVIFIDTQDHIEAFFLMSMLKHNIIGNSSFSWWAAYLNKNPHKIVVGPSHYVAPTSFFAGKSKTVHANMPNWTMIDIDYNHSKVPYPEDMYNYDQYSASLNTQNK